MFSKYSLNLMAASAVISLVTACGGGGGGSGSSSSGSSTGSSSTGGSSTGSSSTGGSSTGSSSTGGSSTGSSSTGGSSTGSSSTGGSSTGSSSTGGSSTGSSSTGGSSTGSSSTGGSSTGSSSTGGSSTGSSSTGSSSTGGSSTGSSSTGGSSTGSSSTGGSSTGSSSTGGSSTGSSSTGGSSTGSSSTGGSSTGSSSTGGSSTGGSSSGGGTNIPSAATSSITAAKTFIDQSSSTGTTITVQLKDSNGANVTTGGDSVELFTTSGTLNTTQSRLATDNGNGTYSVTLVTDENVSAITVSGKVNGADIADTARIGVKVSMNTAPSAKAELGGKIFVDEDLSTPVGQSCATCHDITSGTFIDIRKVNGVNPDTSQGADPADFGGRNSPTASYAAHTPDRFTLDGGKLVGGQFWDGRSVTLDDQALHPFLDSVEMGNPDKATLINKIKAADYADDFKSVFGANSLDNVEMAFSQVAESIAAFERTRIFSPFTSKWDAVQAGTETFTASEANGERLFRNADCDSCHFTPDNLLGAQMFTNFEYENIGVPSQAGNPLLVADPNFKDFGAGSAPADATQGPHSVIPPGVQRGRFKVPTLRNIANTAPYMHNGAFATLLEVVDFYNGTLSNNRDAEVQETVFVQYLRENFFETPQDKQDIINFMNTLSDR